MKILLFQIRNPDDAMLAQEFNCFFTKLRPLDRPFELDSCNIIGNDQDYRDIWQDYDCVMVGGSGDYGCVENNEPWFLTFCEVLRNIVQQEKPLFCSCFGHQALASAMGGEVVKDKSRAELGTHEVTLNEEGQKDPLLGSLNNPFLAQFGHNDHVMKLPRGAVNLASTARCHVQAYTIPGKPLYSTQFHPELSCQENRERAERYFQVYDPSLAQPERLHDLFKPSEPASALLRRFVEMFVS